MPIGFLSCTVNAFTARIIVFPTSPSAALCSPREHHSVSANPSNQHALGQLSHSVSPGYPVVGNISASCRLFIKMINRFPYVTIGECVPHFTGCGTQPRSPGQIFPDSVVHLTSLLDALLAQGNLIEKQRALLKTAGGGNHRSRLADSSLLLQQRCSLFWNLLA